MLMLNVPATVGLVLLAVPIVRVIFERAAFTASDTVATAAALQFYAIGLVGYSVARISSPVFYALRQNRTPVMVSIATVVVNAALNLAFVRLMGYRGLALGTAIAALFNGTVLLVLLNRTLGGLEGARMLSSFIRIAIASALMAFVTVGVDRLLAVSLPAADLGSQIARLTITIVASVSALAVAAHALHIREFRDGVALVARRLGRRTQ
jgi:putative peptidoglycan lipid II flippase